MQCGNKNRNKKELEKRRKMEKPKKPSGSKKLSPSAHGVHVRPSKPSSGPRRACPRRSAPSSSSPLPLIARPRLSSQPSSFLYFSKS